MHVPLPTPCMSLTSSLRWSLYDRALALVPFLLGLGIFAAGVWLGAGAFIEELAFGDPSDAGSPASPVLVGVGVVLGLVVWQIGRSAVRHHTMRSAVEERIDELVDEEAIASAAASKVDDRIADVETDVQQVDRKTTRLEQQFRGDELGEDEFGAGSAGAGGADPADTAATAGGAGAGDEAGFGGDEEAGMTFDDDATSQPEEATDGTAPTNDDGTDSAVGGDDADDAVAEEAGDAETGDGADAGDDADDQHGDDAADGFEWEDDDDGEYYRDT